MSDELREREFGQSVVVYCRYGDDLAAKKKAVAMAFATVKRQGREGKLTKVKIITTEKYEKVLNDYLLELNANAGAITEK